MDTLNVEKRSESPRSVLLKVMNQFNVEDCKIITRTKLNYTSLPDGSNELEEEIALLQEILVRQEKTYNADIIDYERQIQDLQEQLRQNESHNDLLDEKANNESRKDEDLKCIMDKYDEVVCKLVTEKLNVQKQQSDEIEKLEKEVHGKQADLSKIEKDFADLHRNYEEMKKTRPIMEEEFNELKYKLSMSQMALKKNENAYLELEKHAKEQIEKATQEIHSIKQNHLAECARIKVHSKKLELQIRTLESTIQQRIKENFELQMIYDECSNNIQKH